MSDRVHDLKYGDKPPAMPVLDPERGFDSARQILNFSGPDPMPAPLPLRTRVLNDLNAMQAAAEADPDGALDVGVLLRAVRLLVDRVL